MVSVLRRAATLSVLLLVLTVFTSLAQPVLPDITGTAEKGVVLLSWTCQYDGVKSIAVLRSTDSEFNYSTIGYVKKLFKGTQAFADGHPAPGRNFYKLAIVFNSGLTWGSNHYGVDVDALTLNPARPLPGNEALQKLIVTEPAKPQAGTPPPAGNTSAAPKQVYQEVFVKDTTPPPPKLKLTFNDAAEEANYIESMPQATRSKVTISYPDNTTSMAADNTGDKHAVEEKKRIVLTFKDENDMRSYMESMPVAERKNITVTKDTVATVVQQAPPPPPAKPKITISFDDGPIDNVSTTVRSSYVVVDPVSGNININTPPDLATHHYSLKFYDKENHVVIEVPRLNTPKIIMDKRNFQKKGVYKFALRRDIIELERGYITIY